MNNAQHTPGHWHVIKRLIYKGAYRYDIDAVKDHQYQNIATVFMSPTKGVSESGSEV